MLGFAQSVNRPTSIERGNYNAKRYLSPFISGNKKLDSGCWEWQGAKNPRGYGTFMLTHSKAISAYRFSFELVNHKIPSGLELDHLCRNPSCVNPSHLEAVNHSENVLRGLSPLLSAEWQRRKTHCPQGHPYSIENTHHYKGHRHCRICNREVTRRRRMKRAARITDLPEVSR